MFFSQKEASGSNVSTLKYRSAHFITLDCHKSIAGITRGYRQTYLHSYIHTCAQFSVELSCMSLVVRGLQWNPQSWRTKTQKQATEFQPFLLWGDSEFVNVRTIILIMVKFLEYRGYILRM